jgi:hypothetical protein
MRRLKLIPPDPLSVQPAAAMAPMSLCGLMTAGWSKRNGKPEYELG